ncbi:MAG: hypothetical protein QM750_02660 [Rubrivivax sp.]
MHDIDWDIRLGFLIHDVSRLRRCAFDRCLKPMNQQILSGLRQDELDFTARTLDAMKHNVMAYLAACGA